MKEQVILGKPAFLLTNDIVEFHVCDKNFLFGNSHSSLQMP